MLQNAIRNLKNQEGEGEGGFTLIELLVVILIIGILAAIALPTFLGQSDKSKDAAAKSDVRNAVSQIESCLVDQPIDQCAVTTNADLGQFKHLKGSFVSQTTGNLYKVTATSDSTTGGAHTYTIEKKMTGFNYSASDKATGKSAWEASGVPTS